MELPKQIKLRRTGRVAYLKLLSSTRASLYIPGILDVVMSRHDNGAWTLPATHDVKAAMWNVDAKDIYGNGNHSIETLLNDEVNSLINEAMFAE